MQVVLLNKNIYDIIHLQKNKYEEGATNYECRIRNLNIW